MTRGWLWICALVAAAGGAVGGYHLYAPLLKLVVVGAFPYFLKLSSDGAKLAQTSFCVAFALALVSVVLGGLFALRGAKKGRYQLVLFKALLAGATGFAGAVLYYRYQMDVFGARMGEVFDFMRDSRLTLALNPLTRIALISAASALGYGFLKGTLGYTASGK
ncbi:MAG: hypothetical protein AB1705_06750 [Verrucomicrobiota bacterium]